MKTKEDKVQPGSTTIYSLKGEDDRVEVKELLKNIVTDMPELVKLLEECSSHWGYEDPIYRFYHRSHKVYQLQQTTLRIVKHLQRLAPERPLNECFMSIIREGTAGKEDDRCRADSTRPIPEAFFHARYFLEMVVKYGQELKTPPSVMPSGWAALLCLYNMR